MSGCDYSLFKVSHNIAYSIMQIISNYSKLIRVLFSEQDGIEPMWEDERNKRGGRWLITLSKQQRRADLDRFWLETVSLYSLLLV